MGIKLYDTWKKAKHIFVKPKLYWYFGKWQHDPCLPIWRRGPAIYLGKYRHKYQVKDAVMIQTGEKEWMYGGKPIKSKVYDWAPKHKLPGKLKSGDYVWHRSIRKKLKKWHLGWLPTKIQFPIWLAFHIFNHDIIWKTKYDRITFEFPPQFTIVFFGFSLSFWLNCPVKGDCVNSDDYWEGILNVALDNCSLKEVICRSGIWSSFKEDTKYSYFGIRPEFIKPELLPEYYAITSSIKANRDNIIK